MHYSWLGCFVMDKEARLKLARKALSMLLAEDDDALRESLSLFFDSQGYRVFPARSGTEAVEIAIAHRISFSVMDINMPGLTGIEALREIHKELGILPCIFMSGDSSCRMKIKVFEAGGFSFLAKPIKIELMKSSVDRLVRQYFLEDPGERGSPI